MPTAGTDTGMAQDMMTDAKEKGMEGLLSYDVSTSFFSFKGALTRKTAS